MLITLLLWIIISITCYATGLVFLIYLKINKPLKSNENLSNLIETTLLGLTIIGGILQITHLFIPINTNVFFIFITILFFTLILNKNSRTEFIKNLQSFYKLLLKKKLYEYIITTMGALIILSKSSVTPNHYDVDLYHASAIHWIGSFKIILGLGNLHTRLAFNSSWHLVESFFNFASISSKPFHTLNGWLIFIFFAYCIDELNKIFINKKSLIKLTKLFFLFIIFLNPLIKNFTSSPITDIPIMIGILFVILLSLKQKNDAFNQIIISSIISFFITIKLTALPLFFIVIYFILFNKIKQKILIISNILFLIIPYLIRNIILSGYLIYPFHNFDIFNFEWKIPISMVINEKNWIKSWAIKPWTNMDNTLLLKTHEWIPSWIKSIYKNDKLILLIFLLFILIGLINLILQNKTNHLGATIKKYWLILTTQIIGIIYWFLLAPDFRFGYGFIYGLPILIIVIIIFQLKETDKTILSKIIAFSFIIFISFSFIKNFPKTNFIQPQSYQYYPAKKKVVNNQQFFIPINNQKFSTDQISYYNFPSTPKIHDEFVLMGENYVNGFKILK